ncbi:MAG: hypothetical protein HOI35_01880, partial [Woeseia sp.]|nr:hypothetical protein [Woeseia sp.]
GGSAVRKGIGAQFEGDAVIQRVQSTYIRAPDLIGLQQVERAWATFSLNPRRSGNCYAIDGVERWVVHNYMRPDEPDFDSVDRDWAIREILGVGPDFQYEVIQPMDWFGRRLVAVGTNEEAVHLSGINVNHLKLAVFMLAGALAALGGLFHVGYLQSADPNAGIGLELAAIAAVVVGGTSLSGGKGSVVNTFLGVLIIAVLQTGLAQIGASEPTKRVITGLVIIGAVILDVYRNRRYGLGGYFKKVFGWPAIHDGSN